MKTRFLSIIAAALALTACGQKQTQLFNGTDLQGWVPIVDQNDTTGVDPFSVKDGCIAILGQPFGYLRTEKVYGDYKAHLEFRWTDDKGSNSGFFQRVQDDDKVWPHGVECQLGHGNLGEFVALAGAKIEGITPEASGFGFKHRPEDVADPENPVGEWNSIDVEVTGGHIKYSVNGKLINECDTDLTSGHIAVQSEGGPLEIRNIWIIEK